MVIMMCGVLMTGSQFYTTEIMVLGGSAVFGIGYSSIVNPLMPEILTAIENNFKDYDDTALYNNVAGYFIVC